MYRLFLLLLIAAPVSAQSVTPNFTTGSMTQTVTTTQEITEVVETERFGSAINVWSGDNIKSVDANGAATTVNATGVQFEIVDTALPWELEVTSRAAGLIETIDIDRTIETDSVTNTLSVFSQ
jgi:hypothetical protein